MSNNDNSRIILFLNCCVISLELSRRDSSRRDGLYIFMENRAELQIKRINRNKSEYFLFLSETIHVCCDSSLEPVKIYTEAPWSSG